MNSSTIDLSLASQCLTDLLLKCEVLPIEHGSDHRAIDILFELSFEEDLAPLGRRLYEKANWASIQESFRANMPHHRICRTKADLEEYSVNLLHNVTLCLEEIPRAKPSPYAKRWWTPLLTELRKDMSTWLNRWTTSKRQGSPCMSFLINARQAKQLYFWEMKRQKKLYWEAFLEDPHNIWKAHSYTKPAQGFVPIPTLHHEGKIYQSDIEKAELLMQSFFPPQPLANTSNAIQPATLQLPWNPLTKKEIKSAFFSQKQDKAPGLDTIPFRVWRQLWPVVEKHIVQLYTASIDLAYLPESWRIAKIIAMAKPKKKNRTVPNAYRPISLIPTISKGLEAVVANRMSYLAETYGLLPENHFGARKRRSCEQALSVLIEKIYDAWREGKVLTLIFFLAKNPFFDIWPFCLNASFG